MLAGGRGGPVRTGALAMAGREQHCRAGADWSGGDGVDVNRGGLRHTLRIDQLTVPGTDGQLGLARCPGTHESGLARRGRTRAIERDLAAVRDWGASMLVTLMDAQELTRCGVADLGDRARERLTWLWLPIVDRGVPDARFERAWSTAGPMIHERLETGAKVVFHCLAGLGRSGMIAARVLVERGLAAPAAMAAVRTARPGAIETPAQEAYVRALRWPSAGDRGAPEPH